MHACLNGSMVFHQVCMCMHCCSQYELINMIHACIKLYTNACCVHFVVHPAGPFLQL